MSYDPRRLPRQDRWPNATPQEGWPVYTGRDGYRQTAGYRGGSDGGYEGGGAGGHRNGRGYGRARDGGYGGPDGYAGAPGDAAGPADDLDTVDEQDWPARRGRGYDRDPARGGRVLGALTGLLAAAVAIGAAMLAAAFVRPQASPVIALRDAFLDRTPPAVKNFAVEHLGGNGKTTLLVGIIAAIALLAMVMGCLARRNAAIGVGGIAAFALLGAFVAITAPQSRPTDVIPSVIGGIAGIAAFAWLAYASSAVRDAPAGGRGRDW
jgi:hypothetical protein